MKIILDTNILYSAFVKKSPSMANMVRWIAVEHDAIITPYIAKELLRKTIEQEPTELPDVIAFLDSAIASLFDDNPEKGIEAPIINDPKDQEILDAAIYHDVDIIISGDKHFRKLVLERPRVMEAAQFRAEFMSENE